MAANVRTERPGRQPWRRRPRTVLKSHLVIGKQVGNYRVSLEVTGDNLGMLYNAQHVAVGTPVLMRHFAAEFTDVGLVARYLEIGRHLSALGHPGIWGIRESVWSGRNAFIVGEPLPVGISLEQVLVRDGRLWPELCVKLGWQLAAALAAAHSANVFHCRLDGDSVVCFPDEAAPGGYRTKIMVFGVAAFLDNGTPDWRSPRVAAFGPPFYMPPEQCRAGLVDFRGDVYSLGCLLYHMAVGQPPFHGQFPHEIAMAHQTAAPQPLQAFDPTLPFELDALVQRMLTKEPAGRPPMPEVAYELERIAKQYWSAPTAERTVQLDLKIGAPPPHLFEPPPPPPRRSPLMLVAALMGLMAALGITVALVRPWGKKGAPEKVALAEAEAGEPSEPQDRPDMPPLPAYKPPPETPLATQLKGAHAALAEGRFDDARKAVEVAQGLEPKHPEVVKLTALVKTEPKHRRAFDDFMTSAKDKDPVKAQRKLARLPAESFYAPRAAKVMAQIKKDYLHVKLAEARALAETKTCAKLPPIEKQVGAVFPDAAEEFAALTRACAQ
jgi:serine/threonine protein kinase